MPGVRAHLLGEEPEPARGFEVRRGDLDGVRRVHGRRAPLRETAARCGTSLYTAWFMRMRVCEVMSRRLASAREGTFHVDDMHLVLSLLGNHSKSAWFEMPRKARRNGRDGRKEARSCRSRARGGVVRGQRGRRLLLRAGSRGSPVGRGEGVRTRRQDPHGQQDRLRRRPGVRGDAQGARARGGRLPWINMVNALRSRLKSFLARFNGVSTGRLQRYLNWFCYVEQFKAGEADRRGLLFEHEAEGLYAWTRRMTHIEARPFTPYYDRRRYAEWTRHMSMVV